MDYGSLDPYEQQLLKVFNSYDFENRGSLDKEGLTQLCCTLQLEEQGIELVQQLVKESTSKNRVTFAEFKDALLVLLGNVQNTQANSETEKGSPDREVLPKFVYGAKKYGRRSRPKVEENVFKENTNYSNNINCNNSVQRSSSQNDVLYTKKRKTNTKLKRCTSFPGSHDYSHKNKDVSLTTNNAEELVCTEEMLRKAWEKLGVGEDGYLNQQELILVCDAIGFHKLAEGVIKQMSRELEIDEDQKVSFEELFEILQLDDTWSDVLSPNTTDTSLTTVNCLSNSMFPSPKISQHITLGPDGSGFVNADIIIDMWESVGIPTPKLLLQELGFTSFPIHISELAASLEKEIKNLQEIKSETSNPYIILLQAVLALYRSEIRCLKNILEQMHAERDKLKSDVSEANNRATLLAQEVDDNHARMEQNTQNQVKLLEQKHTDYIKDITQQLSSEKDQLTQLNKNLEQKILYLEADEFKLQNDVLIAQEYSATIEKENHILNAQLSELQQLKVALTEQVAILENEKNVYELESQEGQIEPLLKKLAELQIENSSLRDKNDEMLTEIESLNNQIVVMRTKVSSTPTFHTLHQSMDDSISINWDGASFGAKRRNDDSPSKDLTSLCVLGDGSPRLGKVRKCQKAKCDYLDVQLHSSESGFDTELDLIDSPLSASINDSEEIVRLQAKVAHLEKILQLHSITIPPTSLVEAGTATYEMKIKQLTERSTYLEKILVFVQNELKNTLQTRSVCECESANIIKNINEKFKLVNNEILENTTVKSIDINVEDQIQKYIKENQELVTKCAELESCIELLRSEYEKCEDYWASKLDEERQMFEQEQNQSSDKLTELIAKMAEYELQFDQQDTVDYNKLPPIEEKFNLEKQFTDLEQEFEEYKEHAEFQMVEKINELADLNEKLNEIQQKETFNREVQVDLENKMSNLTNCLVESTNLFSVDTMPFAWLKEETITQPNSLDTPNNDTQKRDFVNPVFAWNMNNKVKNECKNEIELNMSYQNVSLSVNTPNNSIGTTSALTDNNTMPIRPKRTRKHQNSYHKVQKMSCQKGEDKEEENVQQNNHCYNKWKNKEYDSTQANNVQTISVPISSIHNLNSRLHHLEQRCRHLQVVLKQQHYHAERMLQHYWQQYRSEKAELQYLLKNSQDKLEHQMSICSDQLERLARTDILVKDLYVENAYLVANVQRLEKQCHILTQYNSSSSSV